MSTAWIPLCRAMQQYCEVYFAAIEAWGNYDDISLLCNRIAMIETSYKIFHEFSQKDETYIFETKWENQDIQLLPTVYPSSGRNFKYNGDIEAFESAQCLVPSTVFNYAGLFFQTYLLKELSGISDSNLSVAKNKTRKSLIDAVLTLFRIPESGGKAVLTSTTATNFPQIFEFSSIPISSTGKSLLSALINSKNCVDLRNSSKSSPSKRCSIANGLHKVNGNAELTESWLSNHKSIGTKVAAFFPCSHSVRNLLYVGKVNLYGPPSSPCAQDQLYHIVWEDGDEQDFDQIEFEAGSKLFEAINPLLETYRKFEGTLVAVNKSLSERRIGNNSSTEFDKVFGKVIKSVPPFASNPGSFYVVWDDGQESVLDEEEFFRACEFHKSIYESDVIEWSEYHASINTNVAAFFDESDTCSGCKSKKLYFGKIVKYARASTERANDQLYHVLWEDGDEQDFDEQEYQEAMQLYKRF